jgi:hypothetical protein
VQRIKIKLKVLEKLGAGDENIEKTRKTNE